MTVLPVPSPPPAPILEFRDVSVTPHHEYRSELRNADLTGLRNASFVLRKRELMLVKMDWGRSPIPRLAQGLGPLKKGVVLFEGRDWQTVPAEENERRRSRIGRVYDEHGWIANLSVAENIYLAQSQHSPRPLHELEEAAFRWARRFFLLQIPQSRPAFVPALELRRLQWVRAFYAWPRLAILEQPELGLGQSYVPELIQATVELRAQGGAVLWLTRDEQVWAHPDVKPDSRYLIRSDHLELQKGAES